MDVKNLESPAVSIGMPVYNGSAYLAEALDSLLNQSYENFEIIISDNASTDKTPDIVNQYQKKDRRIHYYRNDSNFGGAYNDNRVVELATGKYFKWAAHDDNCAPEYLARCVEVLENDDSVVLCYPKTILIDEENNIIREFDDNYHLMELFPFERYKQVLYKYQMLNPLYGVIRLDVLNKTRMIKSYQDSDRVLLAELALQGKFYEYPEYLFFRRMHPEKSTEINKTAEDFAVWYDPQLKGKIVAPKTRRFIGFLSAIFAIKLSLSERLKCLREFLSFYFSLNRAPERLRALNKDIDQAIEVIKRSIARNR